MESLALETRHDACPDHPDRPLSIFCVTVYNERVHLLRNTISSILSGIAHGGSFTGVHQRQCLSIIVDGEDAADPEGLAWLLEIGIISGSTERDDRGCKIHHSRFILRDLKMHFPSCKMPDSWASDIEIEFIVYIKENNQGKLHSHAMFFQEICEALDPVLCFQIDVGTTIDISSYRRLVEKMLANPAIGAIAPCIMTQEPGGESFLISTWQHIDFLRQKSLYWPLEVAAGHLSVIPGQFCVFRWEALKRGGERAPVDDVTARWDRPVDAYVRGLFTSDPFEKLMFLAEDRVIGSEIVLRRGADWRLEYCAESRATTDSCSTLGELMRQRRRWNNSSLACRLWLLRRTPHFARRHDRSAQRKLRFVSAMLFHLLMILVELSAPAISVAVLAAFWNSAASAAAPAQFALLAIFAAGLTWFLLLVAVGSRRGGAQDDRGARLILWVALIPTVAMGGLLALTLPSPSLLLLAVPAIMRVVSLMPLVGSRVTKIVLFDNLYLLTNILLAPLLAAYSIWKVNDISWGTKGLVHAHTDKRMLARTRAFVIAGWLGWNAGIVYVALKIPGLSSAQLNPVFELVCLGSALAAAAALLTFGSKKLADWFRPAGMRRALFERRSHAMAPRECSGIATGTESAEPLPAADASCGA